MAIKKGVCHNQNYNERAVCEDVYIIQALRKHCETKPPKAKAKIIMWGMGRCERDVFIFSLSISS